MTPQETMNTLSAEKGRSFDPRVIEIMERRYLELEEMVNSMETERRRLDLAPTVHRAVAPSSGFAELTNDAEVPATSFLTSTLSALQQTHPLFTLPPTLCTTL